MRNVGTSSTGFATTERTRRKSGIGRITEESLDVTSKLRRLGEHLKVTTGKRKKMTNHGKRWSGTHHSVTNKLVIFYEETKAPSTLIRFQTKTKLFSSVFKKICVHNYRFCIVSARPHYNAVFENASIPSVCKLK